MEKILGIDTGTNSLGWAIVEREDDACRLIDKGVSIFQEGVKVEKGIESSKAADRTGHRATRVKYYRTKLRKIDVLRVLSANHMCPPLTNAELKQWRQKKVYPANDLFMQWQRTDDREGRNPYAYRHMCLHQKLDLDDLQQRYILGRALYHLAQRRGFLSNRKEQNDDTEGKVKESISALTADMHAAGFDYLGDYFHHLYGLGQKIRKHYTARNEHYLAEFRAICQMQQLDADLCAQLQRAIFFQRPLKSQKQQVGHCVFEKRKTRCPSSHPLYEEFRMLAFLNNVKIQTPADDHMRPLNNKERDVFAHIMRTSKKERKFEDLVKKIAQKNNYAFKKENPHKAYLFNYPMDTPVPCCPVTAQLIGIFGDDWLDAVCEVYTLAEGKTRLQILNDVWHALFFYTDADHLATFARQRLQLDDEAAQEFSTIHLSSDYASLSLKAITNMLPYLRRGMIYSHAAFLGNLGKVMPAYEWGNPQMREGAIENIANEINHYDPKTDTRTLEFCIKDYLQSQYHVAPEALDCLYHPSMMEAYPRAKAGADGIYQLGSPRISSVRNPMAMRSMFRMRKLVNRLLAEGKIDRDTTIHIEFARELNDANKRKAIADIQRDNQTEKDRAAKAIVTLYQAETGQTINPTDTDVLKYMLWEEQSHKCLYTGKEIGLTDFIGPDPRFDIEHTIPRSAGGDSTRMNLTLCDSRYNRDVKKTQLPTQLDCYDDILQRVAPWKEKYEALDRQIRKMRTAGAATKEAKDAIIQKRHKLKLQRDYWRGKYMRFEMTEVPEGFSRRQGTDISVISRYARLYLKSVFPKVFTVKGISTSDFRKIWGIQEAYSRKERVNHVHHCIDAIVIACISPAEYSKLAAYYHNEENHRWYGLSCESWPKPWPTFVTDIKHLEQEILVAHHTPDNMRKQGRRRIKGHKGQYAQGDAARGSLHKDTYYGAIDVDGATKYVQRIDIASLDEKNIKNIVDPTVRDIVQRAADAKGLKQAVADTIWMNEEKRIPIKKVRCFAPGVTNPLHIRLQRDLSPKEYKRQYHVMNDNNYMMALYIGKDAKGREKRDFELVNTLDAATFYKTSNDKQSVDHNLVPLMSKHDYPLAYTLKIGTMVLLYEKNPDEIWEATKEELCRRLYKVVGLTTRSVSGYIYGSIKFRHHQEARMAGDINAKSGTYKQGEELRPAILMLHTQINALVEGHDFEINELGEIKRL